MDEIIDALIGHLVDLSRYSNTVAARMVTLLRAVDSDLSALLFSAIERMGPDSFTVRRLDALLTDVNTLLKTATDAAFTDLSASMRDFTAHEVGFQAGLFTRAGVTVAAIDPERVYTAAMAQPLRGRLMMEWASSINAQTLLRINDAIRIGYTESQTTQQIVQRVMGTRANAYQDGLLNVERRHAEAIARTSVSHMASFARERMYEKNKSQFKEKVWISTLDSRTTPECQVRDGLHYSMDNKPLGHKVPWLAGPGRLHWNCRSSSLPIGRNASKLGLDPMDGPRASKDGPVSGKLTYRDWLLRQSAARQDDILGPTRGALLRSGKLKVDRFWNEKGRFLTLDQLRERDSRAFRLAGV